MIQLAPGIFDPSDQVISTHQPAPPLPPERCEGFLERVGGEGDARMAFPRSWMTGKSQPLTLPSRLWGPEGQGEVTIAGINCYC